MGNLVLLERNDAELCCEGARARVGIRLRRYLKAWGHSSRAMKYSCVIVLSRRSAKIICRLIWRAARSSGTFTCRFKRGTVVMKSCSYFSLCWVQQVKRVLIKRGAYKNTIHFIQKCWAKEIERTEYWKFVSNFNVALTYCFTKIHVCAVFLPTNIFTNEYYKTFLVVISIYICRIWK